LLTQPFDPNAKDGNAARIESSSKTEVFDELVMCVLADDALRILGKTSTMKERFVLGGASFFDDITVTHSDSSYFQKHYETTFSPKLCADPKSESQEIQIGFAKGEHRGPKDEAPGFRPMYFTKSYTEDPKKIEMSFDCSNYQHQFREGHETCPVPFDRHVFQSIFLDKENSELWTINEIDESKVIDKKWWHQLGHKWQHYVRVVPGMSTLHNYPSTITNLG